MTSKSAADLPPTYKALQFTSNTSPPKIIDLPTPHPGPGTVLVRPLYSNIVAYSKDIFTNGNPRGYKYPLPLVPGSNSVGRVAAVGSDVTSLRPGQLVWCDPLVRGRDDPDAKILHGLHEGWSDGSRALAAGEWRDGSWAEILKLPAENAHALNEEVLIQKMGYKIIDLGYLGALAVAYGGLRDVDVRPGERVLVAPATGTFGSGAVRLALAMGAGRVVAMGRNKTVLASLKALSPERVDTVDLSGDLETDSAALAVHAPFDVYFDISPPPAGKSGHIKAGIAALRPGGRMSIMGGVAGDVELPYSMIMFKSLTLRGTYMYTPQQVKELIRMVEAGILKIGDGAGRQADSYRLEDWDAALEAAEREAKLGRGVFFAPN